MAAYLIGHIKIHNQSKWDQYVFGVAESLQPYDSEVMFRGKLDRVLAGNDERDHVVVIRFIDQQALDNWFNSDKYQSLIPLRDSAADVVITTYQA